MRLHSRGLFVSLAALSLAAAAATAGGDATTAPTTKQPSAARTCHDVYALSVTYNRQTTVDG